MNPQMSQLAHQASAMIPDWPIQIVPAIETPWMDVGPDAVSALANELKYTYPTAGRHYHAFRTFTLLMWQPVFLTMAATHLAGLYLRQSCIAHQARSCMGWGCEIADHPAPQGREKILFRDAAHDLDAGLKAATGICIETLRIHPKAAARLLGDCVTGATLAIQRRRPDWSYGQASEWGRRWLDALQLKDAAGFFTFQDNDGRRHLAMERKVCCLSFKTGQGALCDTCPRIPVQEQIVRLQRSVAPHVSKISVSRQREECAI